MLLNWQSYLLIALIILISLSFLLLLIFSLVFIYNKKIKTTNIVPLTYDVDLKRIRINDVFSLPALKFIIKNKNLLSGLWITQADFVELLEDKFQKIFFNSLTNWQKQIISIKFKKKFFFNNHFQVFFQAKPENGFVIQEVEKPFFSLRKNKKIFKNRIVEKLILNFELPSFLIAFSFPAKISTEFIKNFFLAYNKKFLFLKKISDFQIFSFENILIMQICAKSTTILEKIKNYYKNYLKNHNLTTFLFWLIIDLDHKINYDWKIEIQKFFDLIIKEKTNFLELKSSRKLFRQIIETNEIQPLFNIENYKIGEVKDFKNHKIFYQVYDFDFYNSQKISDLLKFFTEKSNFDHSSKIYKINDVIAQKMRNLVLDFQKFTFLITSETKIADIDLSYIDNLCYQKTVDSKLFYYLNTKKPPLLFLNDNFNALEKNEANDIIISSLGEYARKEKIKLVIKKEMIRRFNFSQKNFPLYYW